MFLTSIILVIVLLMRCDQFNSEFADWSSDKNPDKWNRQAEETIQNLLKKKMNTNKAKNLIMFIGDGMGISTVTAGRSN